MTAEGSGEAGTAVADERVRPGSVASDRRRDDRVPGRAAAGGLPERVRAIVELVPEAHRGLVAKLVRYALTSGVALGVSEAVLVVLYGTGAMGAATAALTANLVATVPSYLLSRYWIWARAERRGVGRQVVLYWTTSAVSIALLSLATGLVARLAPAGHPFHLLVVAVAFPLLNVVFWVAKFVLYQRVIFLERRRGAPSAELADPLVEQVA
ncbi:MAG: GtrA family protein [Acidimicrobiales bacterium]